MTREDRDLIRKLVDAAKRERLERAGTTSLPEWRGYIDKRGKRILTHSETGYQRGCRCGDCCYAERERGRFRRELERVRVAA